MSNSNDPSAIDEMWAALDVHYRAMGGVMPGDGTRFDEFHLDLPGMVVDYSRQNITPETLLLLSELARLCGVEAQRDRMFAGDVVNPSEGRPALHTALRRPRSDSVIVAGGDIMPGIHDTLDRMTRFVDGVHRGTVRGHTGKAFDRVVHIGIGGSALGPEMAVRALDGHRRPGRRTDFVSSVDGAALASVLAGCNPETTLFLIASKTFTTHETMMNAATARDWLADELGADAVGAHFVALSAAPEKAAQFGIGADYIFPFGDWVGGRYSLWSAVGLPLALAIGMDGFYELLAGAHDMDMHFRTAPLDRNGPVLLGLIGLWNRTVAGCGALAVLPYDVRLARLPAWMQQLDMESNGKPGERPTAPVVFGEPGTDCQHSFFQMIHQGPDVIPCDFIAVARPDHPFAAHHDVLLANMVAQADALALGRAHRDPARHFPGGRPSTVILIDRLDPRHLGRLLALYEHKIFVQGVVWGINSFDQFGVELGKEMANDILKRLQGGRVSGLLARVRG